MPGLHVEFYLGEVHQSSLLSNLGYYNRKLAIHLGLKCDLSSGTAWITAIYRATAAVMNNSQSPSLLQKCHSACGQEEILSLLKKEMILALRKRGGLGTQIEIA